jgi:DNA polymerase III alpha subunit (gram-positive type)
MIILALDTETTGLMESRLLPLDLQPYIIQFCGIVFDLDSANEIDRYVTFIKPPRLDAITEKITQVTRISALDVKDAPSWYEVATKIKTMIESVSAVAAHNLSYDKSMIDIEMERIGKDIVWPERMICTVNSTIYLTGERLNLSRLHEELMGEKFQDAHRADIDTEALVRCLVKMNAMEMI